MRKHPVYAYELLSPIMFLRPALDIPYCHHEKWDGSGYPRGLIGEQIPLAARIFAVVDVWDALRSDRPYRASWPEEKVIEYILGRTGSQFDPQIVALFFNSELFQDRTSGKPTILIVDDEENVTRLLACSLEDRFSVLTANNGFDALKIIQRSDLAVVLTDQRMPGMTGVELLEKNQQIQTQYMRYFNVGVFGCGCFNCSDQPEKCSGIYPQTLGSGSFAEKIGRSGQSLS